MTTTLIKVGPSADWWADTWKLTGDFYLSDSELSDNGTPLYSLTRVNDFEDRTQDEFLVNEAPMEFVVAEYLKANNFVEINAGGGSVNWVWPDADNPVFSISNDGEPIRDFGLVTCWFTSDGELMEMSLVEAVAKCV